MNPAIPVIRGGERYISMKVRGEQNVVVCDQVAVEHYSCGALEVCGLVEL
jgi:hypothetical protein